MSEPVGTNLVSNNKLAKINVDSIVEFKIHPAIGIVRVGNSPHEYFIGPEVPGQIVMMGGYKDAGDPENHIPPRVKRQAARFRIYAYDKAGNVVSEITSDVADITWAVHLVNKKAEWDIFNGIDGEDHALDGQRRPRKEWRNHFIEDRESLIIDPGPRTLTRPSEKVEFNGGKFRGVDVPLGTAMTDENGRLLVLGGYGKSGTTNPNQGISHFANNDFWYDDVSDGPVTAQVKLKERPDVSIDVKPAWVIVAPPDFAPAIPNIVTLYDVAQDTAVQAGMPPHLGKPSFTEHIFPILKRTILQQWVQVRALQAHGPRPLRGYDFEAMMKHLSSKDVNDPENRNSRERIFNSLRNPFETDYDKRVKQANNRFMPYLSGDEGDASLGKPETWFTLTKTQYKIMEAWKNGDFIADWIVTNSSNQDVTPSGLDRASLEAAAGGAFYPGIEGGWIFRNPKVYIEPYRLDHSVLRPGDITKRMACPWQADFFDCNTHWWPAQRPDEVLPLYAYEEIRKIDQKLKTLPKDSEEAKDLELKRTALWTKREPWARGLPPDSPSGREAMVKNWHLLGFVSDRDKDRNPFKLRSVLSDEPRDGFDEPSDEQQMVEIDRGKYDHLSMAEYFHILVNIEDYPDFIPTAKMLAIKFLNGANFGAHAHYARFKYSSEAFDERLEHIYNEYVRNMDKPTFQDSGIIEYDVVVGREGDKEIKDRKKFSVGRFSDRVIKERARQMAPFNLVDGAWLQNILSTGPCDEVQARLFQIWADEAGNGKTELNHPNVYDQLLKSLNIYMPRITEPEFIKQDFLPGAFTAPVFQLVIGLFPQEFFPELLGMTLYLEWEATPTLTPFARMLHNRHINPQFYSMHVAIDNVTAGHGALVKEAVKLYLADKLEKGGERAVQEHWERIWRGYVTWATVGSFGRELLERTLVLDRKQIDIASYILEIDPFNDSNDAAQFVSKLKSGSTPVAAYLRKLLDDAPKELRDLIDKFDGKSVSVHLRDNLVNYLNELPGKNKSVWDEEAFALVPLTDYVKTLIKYKPEGAWLVELNRKLLEAAFPELKKVSPVLFPDFQEYYKRRMIEVVRRKAPIAKYLHKNKMLGANNLMDLFDYPEELVEKLADSQWVDKEHPSSSKFYGLLEFQGPMYKVFSTEEREILEDWLGSLREPQKQITLPQKPGGIPEDLQDPARWMEEFLRTNADRGKQIPAHANIKLKDSNGRPRTVQDWFSDPQGLLEALIRNGWVIPLRPDASKFLQLFEAGGPMAFFGSEVAAAIRKWIRDGARLPTVKGLQTEMVEDVKIKHELMASLFKKSSFAERRHQIGVGMVH